MEDEEVEEDIETQLARLHKEDSKDGEEVEKMEISNNENVIEIRIEQDSTGSFHGFEVQAEETIDTGTVENSDDSEYEQLEQDSNENEEHEEEEEDDEGAALLRAAALAEQGVITHDGTEMVTIKMEPGLEEQLKYESKKGPQTLKKMKSRLIKEEYLEPVSKLNMKHNDDI